MGCKLSYFNAFGRGIQKLGFVNEKSPCRKERETAFSETSNSAAKTSIGVGN
jgi:hypothetical protein